MEMQAVKTMELISPAFEDGQMIPSKYTCDGADVSPPLEWSDVPANAKSLALVADDPDAPMGTWVHWVMYNIPPDTTSIKEHVPAENALSDGTKQGINDFGKIGYGGPCPPSGTHRYFFKLYALDTDLDLPYGTHKSDLLQAMTGHILAEGRLMGTYQRT